MIPSLQNLHLQFSTVFTEETTYLGIQREHLPHALIGTAQKTCSLYEIFEFASNQIIEDTTLVREQNTLPDEIHCLDALKSDADGFYTRYCQKTNTWKRWLLKGLAAHTPGFLQRLLPCIFDNGIERAERLTADNYEEFKTLLNNRITCLQILQNTPRPNPNPNPTPPIRLPDPTPTPPIRLPDPTPIPLNQNEIDLKFQAALLAYKNNKDEQIKQELLQKFNFLNHPKSHVLTVRESNEIIAQIHTLINAFSDQLTLEKKEEFFKTAGISPELIARLNEPSLSPEERLDIASGTSLAESFKNIFKQESITFDGFAKMGGSNIARLKNSKNDQVNEKTLENFSGVVKVHCTGLADLETLLKEKNTCLPTSLEIDFQETALDLAALDLILRLKTRIPAIALVNLTKLDLNELNATAEQEQAWLANLSKISCPHLRTFVLAGHAKSYLSPQDFSNILKTCPTLHLMNQCLQFCTAPKEVQVPHQLTDQKYLNLENYSAELSFHLLSLWSPLKFIKMPPQMTAEDLNHLHLQGILNSAIHLDLSRCTLTTDALFTLTLLPALNVLKLPELTQGTQALSHLPKFDNPFKIHLFYTQSAITRTITHQLYTGLPLWANLFEIQLARKGMAAAISPNQFVLDPHSVANWLYQNDFRHLGMQTSIQSIVADDCAYITDENIVEFVQKFPNTRTISLFNSPHLTDKGVADLLAACPSIKTVDLTGCRQVTDNLLNDALQKIMQERPSLRLMLSDTSISQDQVNLFKSAITKNDRIEFGIRNLKITNAQLVDEESLENILNAQPLHELLRIDLEGCVNLTDQALSKLLDRLNTDQILIQDGTEISNPRRLNIVSLNLTDCSNVTIRAFDGEAADGKIQPKILNSLSQIIIGKTSLNKTPETELEDLDDQLKIDYSDDSESEEELTEEAPILDNNIIESQFVALKNLYPRIDFSEVPLASTYHIYLDRQALECQEYLDSKKLNNGELDSYHFSGLAQNYIRNRIAIELFSGPTASLFHLKQLPVNMHENEFNSMTVAFGVSETGEKTSVNLPKELPYSQSAYLRKALRPGGEMAQTLFIDLINQNATPGAAETIFNLMQGKDAVSSLDWKTASLAAELAKPACLELLESHQRKLIDRFHSQFDTERADEMLLQAFTLEDREGLKQFEKHLILLAEYDFENLEESLFDLADNHHLTALKTKLDELTIERYQNELDPDS